MPVEPDDLRAAMRQWATGVTVVTSHFEGARHGMTVNSFSSVSLEPPLVIVSLERTTRTHRLVELSGVFGITILAVGQQNISDCFAGRLSDAEDRFQGLKTFSLITGSLLLEGGLAFIDCKVASTYEAGTHTLFVAEAVQVQVSQASAKRSPLLYYNRNYHELQK
jgi:flavin reductase (DIM6/NTAB) family NADH-FMN oxidoreductase RutF